MKKVLILGGGFAGVETAIHLQKSKQFEVTLVSDREYLFIYPISIWIPVRTLSFENAKIPLEKIRKKHGFKLIIDKVTGIKASENQLQLETQTLNYDYLVVALGSGKMQPKGIEHTTTICGKPEQTIELRERLDTLIAKGSGKIAIGFGGNPKDKTAVRGGPAFELIFNIHHYLKKKGIRQHFELTMFAPMEEPGARMGKNAMKAVHKMFAAQNIQKQFGKKITEFVTDGVVFEDNSKLTSDLTMFIPAGAGLPLLKNTDLPLSEAGFVKINNYNQVVEFPNVFAIGDAAAYEGSEWTAKQGHIAEVMGSNAAHNILQIEKGLTKLKGYQEHLNILCIMDMGNGAAFVYRDNKREIMIPMPVIGHWLKKAWGIYAKWTKLGKFPTII
ncbi:MAG: FAD-dependent oxidoreductase [Paludibacter sp.]|nr:FAD-dependent oxidoreductase [Paludibacter sp.]